MIILPYRPRRIDIISFWLATSLFSGLLMGTILWFFFSPQRFIFGAIFAFVLFLPGMVYPQTLSLPYSIWNKIARYFASVASIALMGICFYIIFLAVGRTGSRLMVDRPSSIKSLWYPRRTLTPATYISQHHAAEKDFPGKSWISSYLSWAVKSDNLWACSLLPFLILLSFLETGQETTVSSSVYTLY